MAAEQAQDVGACAREPIHVPGSIQPLGLLLVIDPASERIVQAAGDAAALLGVNGALPGRTALDVLGTSLADLLSQGGGAPLSHEPAYLGTLHRASGDLTLLAHRVDAAIVVEALPAGRSASASGTLARIRSITENIGGASDILDACRIAAAEVRRITGYDRIMIYRFLPDGSGSVIAEVKDPALAPFLNHRYPESDIPSQARELYRRSAIRVIPDVHYVPAPLVPALTPATGRPLDMSYCVLRSVSPVHIRYLRNMQVGASMSVSLLPRGDLWGLIACHNTRPAPVDYEAREACRHVGQILSQLIAARNDNDADRTARQLAAARDGVTGALAAAQDRDVVLEICPALQTIVECDGAAVVAGERIVVAGHAPSAREVGRLASRLEPRLAENEWLVTDRLPEFDPEAAGFASVASGLLATRLPGEDQVTCLWFRAEQAQEVLWAGNPHQPVDPSSPPGSLNPRASFETWRETVRGRSRPWRSADIDSVRAFRPAAAFLLQQQRVRHLNQLLADANRQLATLALTDGLTGIPNRRAFDERLQAEWARAERSGQALALLVLDLDCFKQYNDRFGHPAGDECLRRIARCLEERRRTTDFAARVGGEEFALLLPDTGRDGARTLAEAVRASIEQLQIAHPNNSGGVMTASIGAATAVPSAGVAHDLMKLADRALYESKRRGRNRIVLQASPTAVP